MSAEGISAGGGEEDKFVLKSRRTACCRCPSKTTLELPGRILEACLRYSAMRLPREVAGS